MARFKADEVDNYGGQGGTGFFYLKNDKEVATVRFMYDSIDDVEGMSVHTLEIGDKKRYVNCLREYNDPIDKCPFCREKMFTAAKLFIPLYDCETGSVKIWERGKKFFGKISSICARYPNTVSHKFEIERNGQKGDTSTTYEIYEVDKDDITLEDLPDVPTILGGLVLDKSAEDMEYFLEAGQFPPEDGDDVPARRNRNASAEPRRRTPANGNYRREAF